MSDESRVPVRVNWEVLALWFGRGLLMVALAMGKQLLNKVDELTNAQAEQTTQLKAMAEELHSRTALRWTSIDQRYWANLLAQRNPTVIVPMPEHLNLPGEVER